MQHHYDSPVNFTHITMHTYAQIFRQQCRESIKSKPVEFNFQSSKIFGKVEQVTGEKWQAALEGSAQVSASFVTPKKPLCPGILIFEW